jgi:hypothetical protein
MLLLLFSEDGYIIEDLKMIGQLFTTGIGIYQMYPGTENKWIAQNGLPKLILRMKVMPN